jgi:hypothetical protein
VYAGSRDLFSCWKRAEVMGKRRFVGNALRLPERDHVARLGRGVLPGVFAWFIVE